MNEKQPIVLYCHGRPSAVYHVGDVLVVTEVHDVFILPGPDRDGWIESARLVAIKLEDVPLSTIMDSITRSCAAYPSDVE